MRAAGLLLLLLAALPVTALSAEPAGRTEVPITGVVQTGGVMRYTVPVTVGGQPVTAMLDTGSAGLHLMPQAVKTDAYRISERDTQASYGSGVRLKGKLARADVSIGGAASVTATVEIVDDVACLPGRPQCPASRIDPEDYRIGGNGRVGEGFAAILGAGLRATDTENPLLQSTDGAWIISLPRPGEAAPGRLIINPTPEEKRGFTLFQLAPQQGPRGKGWADVALPACLVVKTVEKPICGPTLLDTGAPNLHLTSTEITRTWRPGDAARLVFGEGAAALAADFILGEGPGARLSVSPPGAGRKREGLNAGILPFYTFDVLYDARNGQIGLRRRPPLAR